MSYRIFFCLVVLLNLTACGNVSLTIGIGEQRQELEYTIVEEAERSTRNRVAIVDISGMIFNGRRAGILREGENPVSILHEKLEKARLDPNVRAATTTWSRA